MLLLALWSAVYYSTFHPLAPEKGTLAGCRSPSLFDRRVFLLFSLMRLRIAGAEGSGSHSSASPNLTWSRLALLSLISYHGSVRPADSEPHHTSAYLQPVGGRGLRLYREDFSIGYL